MTASLIQTKTGSSVNNTTAISLALASNTVTGDTIIVAVCEDHGTDVVSSVTATGMTFNKIAAASGLNADSTTYLSIWYAFNVTGATTPTISINKTSTFSGEAVARHYRGLTTTDPLDKVATATGTGTASASGNTATLTQANELAVGIHASDFGGATFTVGATYGNLIQITANGNSELATQDKIVAATTAISSPMGSNGSAAWRASLLTLLIAGGTVNPMLPASGSFSISGKNAALTKALNMTPASGAFSISGKNATLSHGYNLLATSGLYSISGQNAALTKALHITPVSGSFSISGHNAALQVGRKIAAASGAFSIAGQNANLVYVPHSGAYALAAACGVFGIAGNDAALVFVSSGVVLLGGKAYSWKTPYAEHHEDEYQRDKVAAELRRIEGEITEAEKRKELAHKRATARLAEKNAALKAAALEAKLQEEINGLRMMRIQLMRLIDDEEAILVISMRKRRRLI